MYDRKLKKWISDCDTPELAQECKKPENVEKPETQFLIASDLLSKSDSKDNLIQAVAKMDLLVKKEHLPALFAMGQMKYYGFAVGKDRKTAMELYKKAASAGYEPAKNELARLRKEKRIKVSGIVVPAVLVIVAAVVAIVIYLTGDLQIIRVSDETELAQVTTAKEFSGELISLISEYDDEAVISGQVSTNRITLRFEGNILDLSDFFAERVVARENNIVVIQFATEEEALECLEILKNQKNIVFAEMDAYDVSFDTVSEEYCTLTPVGSIDPTDEYDSWGVADMGLDKLSEYVSKNFSSERINVAVVDSGALIHSEYKDRHLEGVNVVTGGEVSPHYHGTHVCGTILEGAKCDNVYVKNYDVTNGECYTSELLISTGIDMAVEDGADVINLSMGGPCHPLKDMSVENAIEQGVIFVTSAGNESHEIENNCPAHMEKAITVAAYDLNHNMAYFTNYGEGVDVSAPGYEVWNLSEEGDGMLACLNGTSMASPHVAAMAALLKLIYPDATVDEIDNYIKKSCRTFRNPNEFSSGQYGEGAPDATIFIE